MQHCITQLLPFLRTFSALNMISKKCSFPVNIFRQHFSSTFFGLTMTTVLHPLHICAVHNVRFATPLAWRSPAEARLNSVWQKRSLTQSLVRIPYQLPKNKKVETRIIRTDDLIPCQTMMTTLYKLNTAKFSSQTK